MGKVRENLEVRYSLGHPEIFNAVMLNVTLSSSNQLYHVFNDVSLLDRLERIPLRLLQLLCCLRSYLLGLP